MEEKLEKLYNVDELNYAYSTVEWRLFKKLATAEPYALVNKAVLNNPEFVCSSGLQNEFEIQDKTGKFFIDFKETTKYQTYLPAWIIGKDTSIYLYIYQY